LPTLLETSGQPSTDVRVVFLSSVMFSGHPRGGILFPSLKTPQSFAVAGPWQRYGQAKLANILYAAELARRYLDSEILFLSIHHGTINAALVSN
jgi:NAD(P)-dependent dehydrogenase (short-subunit alcohol dehydrogenase family)